MKAGAAGILGAVLEICNSSKSTRAVFAETITDMIYRMSIVELFMTENANRDCLN